MKVHLASDHAGFELKEFVKEFLMSKSYEVQDYGAYSLDKNDDYPDFIAPAIRDIQGNSDIRAIIFGGSGQGEAMVANRFLGIRAIVINCNNLELVKLGREHNDANVMSIGARFVDKDFVLEAADLFLHTEFSQNERHVRRLNKIKNINI